MPPRLVPVAVKRKLREEFEVSKIKDKPTEWVSYLFVDVLFR